MSDLGFRVQGFWFRVYDLGLVLRVEGLGSRVWDSGFRVWGFGPGFRI